MTAATYLEITAGVVTNRVLCDQGFADENGYVGPNETANIGDDYDAETGEATPRPPHQPTIAQRRVIITDRINARRDEVIEGGFAHEGKTYQSRQTDRENIKWYFDQAKDAVAAGAEHGDLMWCEECDPDPFVFRTADNVWTPMDAHQMFAFGKRAAAFKRGATFHAIGLKAAVDASNVTHDQLNAIETQTEESWPV